MAKGKWGRVELGCGDEGETLVGVVRAEWAGEMWEFPWEFGGVVAVLAEEACMVVVMVIDENATAHTCTGTVEFAT